MSEIQVAQTLPIPRGRVSLFVPGRDRRGTRQLRRHACKYNQIQAGWAYASAMALGRRDMKYAISGILFEFENMTDTVTAVTPPTYEAREGIEYYAELVASGTKDVLRTSLLSDPKLDIEPGYESYFGQDAGNRLQFFGMTTGTRGIHGKTFGSGVNSRIYGLALVAQPAPNDWTQDIVIARLYFNDDEQLVKPASHQAYAAWELIFTLDS